MKRFARLLAVVSLVAIVPMTGANAATAVVLTPLHPVADFDLRVLSSDAEGARGSQAGLSGGAPIADDPDSVERVSISVTFTDEAPVHYLRAEAVYFAAPSTYTLDVSI